MPAPRSAPGCAEGVRLGRVDRRLIRCDATRESSTGVKDLGCVQEDGAADEA